METNSVYIDSSANLSENPNLLQGLLAKAKQGDQAAFTELYNQFFKKIYRFIYFRVGHKEVAEDLTEDVFIKAYGKLNTVNQDNSFEGWLYQIARNKIIDYYREKKLTVALDEVENTLIYESNIINAIDLKQQQKTFLELLRELTLEQQMMVKMKFLENLENPEIAEIMQKSEGAIRVIQHRAIAKLQELIKKNNLGN